MAAKSPDYVIPVQEIGPVIYWEKKSVGIQFVDPSGAHCFLSLPGSLIQALARDLERAATDHPEILKWPAAPIPPLQ